MRYKYGTRGIVLARAPLGETSASVAILTPDIGLVRARAQGVRRSGAKLAAALATYAESTVVLVRGKEQWRIAGAVLEQNWFARLARPEPRARAARVTGLLLRLVAGEAHDVTLFPILTGFFAALTTLPEEAHPSIETLAVVRVLAALGLAKDDVLGTDASAFAPSLLSAVREDAAAYVARINDGIAASGL